MRRGFYSKKNMGKDNSVDVAKNFLLQEKEGATWLSFLQINDLLNYSEVSRRYFNRSATWILQRLHGYTVNGKQAKFKPAEYTKLIAALRDMAKLFSEAADNIENAAPDED